MRHWCRRRAGSLYCRLNYTVRLTAKTLKGFITSLMIAKLATTVIASFKFSWSLVSNAVVISLYGMWIPVFIKKTEPDFLENSRKRVSCREKKPDFAKLRPVYKVQNAWELRPQDERTSGSFLRWCLQGSFADAVQMTSTEQENFQPWRKLSMSNNATCPPPPLTCTSVSFTLKTRVWFAHPCGAEASNTHASQLRET